jgi:hypothetical protein
MKITVSYFLAAVCLSMLYGCRSGDILKEKSFLCTPETFHHQLDLRCDREGRLADNSHFILLPGHYHLSPMKYIEGRCGNCEDPNTTVEATAGLVVSGRGITIRGGGDSYGDVVIRTGAGYGILFEDCRDCRLEGVTVTGGIRDFDSNATDAAVVVKNSTVRIENCIIRDNIGDSTIVVNHVVGVMGITGREGADMTVRRNRIIRNSWDGIALYRDARAIIEDNLIDGIDKAGGKETGGGRGVGIGVTWDADAVIRRNRVTRYWKGIGLFVDARSEVMDNVVEEMRTWGIAYWDAGRGKPSARIEHNIIFDTGACGISITRREGGVPAPGYCRENIIARTGSNPRYDDPEYYCYQRPLAVHAVPQDFEISDNWRFDNRRAPVTGGDGAFRPASDDADLDMDEFTEKTAPLIKRLERYDSLKGSRCFRELPRCEGE